MITPCPVSPCPHCGADNTPIMSIAPGGQERAPTAGDVTVCASCGAILAFDHDLRRRPVTHADLRDLPATFYQQIIDAQRAAWRGAAARIGASLRAPTVGKA